MGLYYYSLIKSHMGPTSSRLPPNSMTLDDSEFQNTDFMDFVTISGCETHLKSEMHWNQLK